MINAFDKKTEDERRERDCKLPIDVLVTLGDSLHDCTASFVLTLHPDSKQNDTNEITFASHGTKKQLITMFTEMFKDNNEYIEIIMEAVVRCKLDRLISDNSKDI